jgi:DNA-binding response OmpR family regulator
MLYPLSYEGGVRERSAVPGWARIAVPSGRPCRQGVGRAVGCAAMAGPTVLVVEDDPTILQLLEVNFEMEGFTVLRAEDGALGLEAARASQPDVIVSDVMMPNMSGVEMVAALKADDATAGIPIILLSAKAQGGDIRQGIDAGADEYVTKPFEPLDLIDRVNALLAR